MAVDRLMPTEESEELIALTREICQEVLAPRVDAAEAEARLDRDVFRQLGRTGLLSLTYPEEFGGADQPYEVYLQVLEEIGAVWMSVAVGVSVHSLTCFPMMTFGSDEQKQRWLPDMLGGEQLGAYCLSEPEAGSDVAAVNCRATLDGDAYVVKGTKAWISHAGHADFYTTFVRTSDDGPKGLSCLHIPADTPGIEFAPPERKMGLDSDTVGQVIFVDARVPVENLIGTPGDGMKIALSALDAGRLGIAAASTGLAQGALDHAVAYAKDRVTFGKPIIEHQGLAFLLADMEAAVSSARATYVMAARMKDAGKNISKLASVAKMVATDAAMKVTTDAVQVFGGAGYTKDWPVERYMREAKVTQIFEGTNQIQRMVIGRHLAR